MLTLEIKNGGYGQYEKYIVSHIDYRNGYGSWHHPIGNNRENGITKEEAKYIAEEVLKTVNECLKKIGK